jgi:hypothetical protein
MFAKVIARENAVAICEKQIRRGARANAVIAAEGHAKTLMRMRCQLDWKIDSFRKFPHDAMRAVLGTVICNDDFKFAFDASLVRQRS